MSHTSSLTARFVLVEGEAENEGDGTCRGRALRQLSAKMGVYRVYMGVDRAYVGYVGFIWGYIGFR